MNRIKLIIAEMLFPKTYFYFCMFIRITIERHQNTVQRNWFTGRKPPSYLLTFLQINERLCLSVRPDITIPVDWA